MRKFISLILAVCFLFSVVLLASCGDKNEELTWLELDNTFNQPTTLEDGGGQRVKVVLVLGQSNATGCALNSYLEKNIDSEQYKIYEDGFSNVLINHLEDNKRNTSGGEFVTTKLGCGVTDEYFGPELGIAEKLSKEYPDEKIVILKYTYSGSCLKTQWLYGDERGSIYEAFMLFTKTYMDALISHNYDAKIGAVCWMQGESDASGKVADEYYDNQSFFVSCIREDLKAYEENGGIYFIDAGIEDISLWKRYEVINSAKERFANSSPLNLYFSTVDAGLTTEAEPEGEPDIAHYDSMSELKLGHLVGEHIILSYRERSK